MKIQRRTFKGCFEDEISFMVASTGTTDRFELYQELLRYNHPTATNDDSRLSLEFIFSYSNRPFRIWFFDSDFDDGTNRGSSALANYIRGAKLGLFLVNLSSQESVQKFPESINLLKSQFELPFMIIGIKKESSRFISFEGTQELALKFNCSYRELEFNSEGIGLLIESIVNFVIESDEQINMHFKSFSE